MKPGSFTQLYVHLVFAVKHRDAVLKKSVKEKVCRYLSGILREMGHKPIIVNGGVDHVHILIGLNPSLAIADTVRDVKRSSSMFINREKLCIGKFEWQEGYGGFTYGKSQLNAVYHYILNQEKHHQKKTFREEYIQFLNRFEVEYDPKYLFDFFEEV
eukprot:TRINITY_DN118_c0_g1_i3.p2 TRINITY_DN118_c0_g1~~TRINITY_DN118_c0_g1_i3.p2  ORF type:complete len:157 (+),score=25.29 TRINITY_DN118_c0_g1_i3:163-633(+)